jgi:AcrR family transcriptional regulator
VKPKDDKKIAEIFAATLELVRQEGLSGITMSMIAKKAGLATGTLYVYFKNKEELILTLFEKCIQHNAENYFVGFDPHGPIKLTFRTVFMNMAHYGISHFEEVIFVEQCFHSPFIPEETRVITKQMFRSWYSFVDRGKAEKLIKHVDTVWLLIYVRGIIREMVKQAYYNGTKPTQAMMDQMFELCWDGIKD